MKTKSYTKYLGILLVIVSVFTLFFNWISAARYIKNLQNLFRLCYMAQIQGYIRFYGRL